MKHTFIQSAIVTALVAALIGIAPTASRAADTTRVSPSEKKSDSTEVCSSQTACSVSWPVSPIRASAALPVTSRDPRNASMNYTPEPASTAISATTFSLVMREIPLGQAFIW